MNEKRLQEIKDSIDLQEKIMTKNMLVDEEKELYDEVVRLTNIINELEKALKDHQEIKQRTNTKEYYIEVDEVLDKLNELKSGDNK